MLQAHYPTGQALRDGVDMVTKSRLLASAGN
jgi:hypothetical protein